METTAPTQRASLAWKLALLLPLVPAVLLQVIAHGQADIHTQVKLSTIGSLFLSVSLILQSLFLMRTSTKWGIAMLIFTSAVLGFGLHTLLRVL